MIHYAKFQNPQIEKYIRQQAQTLARCKGFTRQDVSDLEQEFRLHLLRKLHLFDSQRDLLGFVWSILANHGHNLRRYRQAQIRSPEFSNQGVFTKRFEDKAGSIPQRNYDRRRRRFPRSDQESMELMADVNTAIAQLTPRQREIAILLQNQPIEIVTRWLGKSKGSFYAVLHRIRKKFAKAGLHEYLGGILPDVGGQN